MALRDNPDGTQIVYLPENDYVGKVELVQTPLPVPWMFDDLSAVQTAIATILQGLALYSVDRKALSQGRTEVGEMRIQHIYYDTPRPEDDLKYPAATISAQDTTTIDLEDTNFQQLDEGTLDQYGVGTIVQKLGWLRTPMLVTCWFGNKDDRAGARKVLMEYFAGELWDERPGRRISMPYYYDRIARLDLITIGYPDDPEKSKANEFPLVMNFDTETEWVRLVHAPGTMQVPNFAITNL